MANKPIKIRIEWLLAILPAFVGVFIVVLLEELHELEFDFTINDLDTFIILFGLLITVILAAILISREMMKQIRILSDQKAIQIFTEDRARFLGRLDHEMKNPLLGIRLALDNLAETTDVEHRQQIRYELYGQIDRLNRLVSDLRKIGDLDNQKLEWLSIDTTSLLQDVFHYAQDHEEASLRDMKIMIPDSLPLIIGDYDLLLLAIYNVLNNAIKYSHDGDKIDLRASTNDDAITISISDTGSGIADEDLPYVWDELYRSEAVKGIVGRGIGLSLVRRIIERHFGNVQITSELGRGTTVTLRLPILVTN